VIDDLPVTHDDFLDLGAEAFEGGDEVLNSSVLGHLGSSPADSARCVAIIRTQ
jgi:hypothetical protein